MNVLFKRKKIRLVTWKSFLTKNDSASLSIVSLPYFFASYRFINSFDNMTMALNLMDLR